MEGGGEKEREGGPLKQIGWLIGKQLTCILLDQRAVPPAYLVGLPSSVSASVSLTILWNSFSPQLNASEGTGRRSIML